MKNSKFKIQNWFLFCFLLFVTGSFADGQSTSQNFPTPITANEIKGIIKARDIGDARLTSYFYVFNGNQGDIFINVVTKNLDGDIDIFTAEGLQPLTKIRVYSDNPDSETGRVIYLRQPQRLILRIEGKTPTDDAASYRIKFAGSFQPLEAVAESEDLKQPEVTSKEETDVRVNSVGTIIEVKPKPTPKPRETTAKVDKQIPTRKPEKTESEKSETEISKQEESKKDAPKSEEKIEQKKPELVIDNDRRSKNEETEPQESIKPNNKKTPRTKARVEPKPKTEPEKKSEVAPVDPTELVNIRLIVDFKDGKKIERPLSEILKFGVDKGILTIIAKDGSIGRYSMLEIAKITIE